MSDPKWLALDTCTYTYKQHYIGSEYMYVYIYMCVYTYIYPHIKYNTHVYIYACACVFLYRDRKSKEETMKRGLWEEFEGEGKKGVM